MPRFIGVMSGDHQVFARMKEKGLSLAAFATTVLFLVLTAIMVSVTLQSAYSWLVMGSTLFLFITLCSYSSCDNTYWNRATVHSDSISTISDGHDSVTSVEHNRSVLPYWVTDLPPSYAAATSERAENLTGRINSYPPPPPYTLAVEPPIGLGSSTAPSGGRCSTGGQHQQQNGNAHTPHTLTEPTPRPYRESIKSLQDSGPPEHIHSQRIPSNAVRSSLSDNHTVFLDRHLTECKTNKTTDENSSVC